MDKEQIYDSEIAPLMVRIIEVCKANKIPMLATFHIPADDDDNLSCTTALLEDDFDPPARLIEALRLIRPPSPAPLTLTTRDAAGNIVSMETIL